MFSYSIKLIRFIFFAFLLFDFEFVSAQNIGIGTNTPHASAALDVASTNTGFLPPRMTLAQRNSIANPSKGLMFFCTDCSTNGEMQFYNGNLWVAMSTQAGTAAGQMMYWNGSAWVNVIPGTYGQSLVYCDGVPTWGGCVPKVATGFLSAVSYTSLSTGGNVIAEGGFSVSSRGVCWSTIPNPTVALTTKTIDGTGIGNFTSSITGLTPNTTYYVRAYATNSVGTGYGADSLLITKALEPPIIDTTTVTAISYNSANSGGNVANDGGAAVTARGVCWSTNPNPTVSLSTKTVDGTGTGSFTSSITGLTPNTTYYLRAYAINSVGTTYGTQQIFTTVSNDVNLPSVTIGTQIWSIKNLDVATYRNGDPIPQVTDPTQWTYLTTGAWCWYNNDSATYGATYGRLYNWYAVNDPRGLAPQGWHVPTNSEWDVMTKYLDPTVDTTTTTGFGGTGTDIGTQLKNTSGWNSSGNGTNSSGFAGLPGGMCNGQGQFVIIGNRGYWWSASQHGSSSPAQAAWWRGLEYNKSSVQRTNTLSRNGVSVRVVKD
jgi:uncharacterized protein (TIGR02145 family)